MSHPLRSLADAARAVTAAATDEDVLTIVADAARDVIGARHGVARRGADGAPPGPRLVAPLVARDGSSLGLIELWDKPGEFTADDEAILVQLAQMAANAIETLELLNREHAARVEAEETDAGCCARSSAPRRCSASAARSPAGSSCRRSSSSPPTRRAS